jgi:hypothetical protein
LRQGARGKGWRQNGLWNSYALRYAPPLPRTGGREVDTRGDSFFATQAVVAAVASQRSLTAAAWSEGGRLLPLDASTSAAYQARRVPARTVPSPKTERKTEQEAQRCSTSATLASPCDLMRQSAAGSASFASRTSFPANSGCARRIAECSSSSPAGPSTTTASSSTARRARATRPSSSTPHTNPFQMERSTSRRGRRTTTN